MNHIAICMPCIDKVHPLTVFSMNQMFYHLGRGGVGVATIMHQSSLIHRARNECIAHVEKIEAKGTAFDWVMFIDSDMTFPQNVIQRLMAHGKMVIGCTYQRRTPPYDTHGRTLEGKPTKVDGGLLEVAGLPTGMLLIHRDVFRALKRPYFRCPFVEETDTTPAWEAGEDYSFSDRVRAAGFNIYLDVDLSKSIGHIAEKTLYPDQEVWHLTADEAETPEGLKARITHLQGKLMDQLKVTNGARL